MPNEEKKKKRNARLPALLTALVALAVLLALALPGGDKAESPAAAQPGDSVSAASAPAEPTSLPPPAPSSSTVPSAAAPDFSDAAFVGNSFVDDLNTYNLLPNADCFGRVGLNVRTALTKPTLKGDQPIIDELKNKRYARIFLVFGENELGWNTADAFAESYAALIDQVRARQPDATIYIESIFPVSAEVSAENVDQTNNERIAAYNRRLERLAAEKNAVYLDGASVLRDEKGELPADAATDGVHPKISYYRQWVAYIMTHAS